MLYDYDRNDFLSPEIRSCNDGRGKVYDGV